MTQQNDYHLPTSELMQAGERLARLGLECPWVGENAWCYLEGECVYGDLLAEYDADKRHTENRAVRCPPAVAAAVVAFAGEVRAWLLWRHHTYSEVAANEEGKWDMFCDHPDDPDLARMYQEHDTQLSAAVALILAVHNAVEGE